jgi:hypothetical protein
MFDFSSSTFFGEKIKRHERHCPCALVALRTQDSAVANDEIFKTPIKVLSSPQHHIKLPGLTSR